MTTEEKAKAYDEALEKAKEINNEHKAQPFDVMLKVFPELKESEDEKIRQFLIHEVTETSDKIMSYHNMNKKNVLAWLEKQAEQKVTNNQFTSEQASVLDKHIDKFLEQKPADRVEPKFKVGDFIVNDYCMGKVIELTNDAYLLDTGQGIPFSYEHNAHLWTIQDAKDGDILQLGKVTAIFKEFVGNNCICYCSISNGEFEIPSQDGEDNIYGCHNATPATKKQRDILMKAIADAGYTFDFEKEELKKIEQKQVIVINYPDNLPKDNWELIHEFVNKFGRIPKDEDELHVLINYVLTRQNPAWSEEDELMLMSIIQTLKSTNGAAQMKIDWLESLRPQSTWKPSDEHYELEEFAKIVRCNLTGISKAVQKLFETKYLQLTGNRMYGGFKD